MMTDTAPAGISINGAAVNFLVDLTKAAVPIFTHATDTWPPGWQSTTVDQFAAQFGAHRAGGAINAVCGGVIVVVDVDPRNSGDVERVRELLHGLGVRIFAEISTPGGGRHFYIAGHPDVPTSHSPLGWPGLDIQSFGSNVYLPGTTRSEYPGRGYEIISNDLAALTDGDDPDGAEVFAGWVAEHRIAPPGRGGASGAAVGRTTQQPGLPGRRRQK